MCVYKDKDPVVRQLHSILRLQTLLVVVCVCGCVCAHVRVRARALYLKCGVAASSINHLM